MIKNILRGSLLYSSGLLLGRLSGYLRELIIADKFSVSQKADSILLLLTFPDFITNLLSVTTIGAVLIPLFNASASNSGEIIRSASKTMLRLSVLFLAINFIVLKLLYPGPLSNQIFIASLSVIPNVLAAVLISFLNYRMRFFVASLGTLIFNASLIIFIMLFYRSVEMIAIGVIIAAAIRLLSVYLDVRYSRSRQPLPTGESAPVNISFKKMVITIFSNGLFFFIPLVDKIFASKLSEGSVALLSYSEKIYMLPVSLFLTSFAVTAFPVLSRHFEEADIAGLKQFFRKMVRITMLMSALVGIVFYFALPYVVKIMFGITRLEEQNLQDITLITKGYVGALIFAGGNALLINTLFAMKRYKAVFAISIMLVLTKLITNTLLVYFRTDVYAIAVSTSILAALQFLICLFVLKAGMGQAEKTWLPGN